MWMRESSCPTLACSVSTTSTTGRTNHRMYRRIRRGFLMACACRFSRGQIKWTPKPWLNIISNNYGLGEDDLFIRGRSRIHTDNSIEVKYYDKPEKMLDKMAFSLTGDLGCEYGSGVSCYGNHKGGPKQSFIGYMVYN